MKLSFRSRKLAFTREGKIYVFLCLAIGVAAINTGSNLLFLLLSLMLSIIISSGILSENTLRNLEIKRRGTAKALCNEPFLYRFEVKNRKKVFPSYCINVKEETLDVSSQFILNLNPGCKAKPFIKAVFSKRGIHPLDRITLESTYPFGFFRKSKTISLPGSITIFPLIKNVPHKILDALTKSRTKHLPVSLSRISEEHFFGLKEYRVGDNPKLIYWKSLAKYREPMIKENEELTGSAVDILLDLSFSGNSNQSVTEKERIFESALCFCASVIHFLLKQDSLIGFKIIHSDSIVFELIPSGCEKDRVMKELASLDFKKFVSAKLNTADERRLGNSGPRGQFIIILSEDRRSLYASRLGTSSMNNKIFCMEEKELLNEYYPYDS